MGPLEPLGVEPAGHRAGEPRDRPVSVAGRRGGPEPGKVEGEDLAPGGEAVEDGSPRPPVVADPVEEDEHGAGAQADVMEHEGGRR